MSKESEELIGKIRALNTSLEKAKISRIQIFKEERTMKVTIIAPAVVDLKLKKSVEEIFRGYFPDGIDTFSIYFSKIICDEEVIIGDAYAFIVKNCILIAPYVKTDDIKVEIGEDIVAVSVSMGTNSVRYFSGSGDDSRLKENLERQYCATFKIEVIDKGRDDVDNTPRHGLVLTPEVKRVLKVTDVYKIDDNELFDTATYMCDAIHYGGVIFAGTITEIDERDNKKGNGKYYLITYTDQTASFRGLYSPRMSAVEKFKKLQVGDGIITRGVLSDYNDKMSLKINSLNGCKFPENFIPADKPHLPCPEFYNLIKPQKVETAAQTALMSDDEGLELLKGNTYVVFDFETTGLEVLVDAVTEVGAVKIVDGVIKESFQTLINPCRKIPEEITNITGIDNEMCKDAPLFAAVVPDFYKFSYGCTLIGHNVDFDYKFLRAATKDLPYFFNNKRIDTCVFAQKALGGKTKNFRLNTVCDYLGIKFHHHRALSDAFAEGELFIELVRRQKCLPKAI